MLKIMKLIAATSYTPTHCH